MRIPAARKENEMANPLLPPEERHLTPDQVEALDKRRDRPRRQAHTRFLQE